MTSCVEEYLPSSSDFESELVVNSLFNPESPWSISISNSAHLFDQTTDVEKITNAKVEIYDQHNDFLYELFHIENGNYGFDDYSPSPKRGYSVKVSASGFHAVTAKSFAPEKSTLLINNFSIIPNEKYNDVEVDFEIEDRSELESYYVWEIVNIEGNSGYGQEPSSGLLSGKWIDDLTNPDNLINTGRDILEGGSFGDGTYNGTYNSTDGNRRVGSGNNDYTDTQLVNYANDISATGKLNPNINYLDEVYQNDLDNGGLNEDEDPDKIEFKYELRVMTISKELYNYYTSLEAYYQDNDNNHSSKVPLGIYTNVSNGEGIFAGFSESVIQF